MLAKIQKWGNSQGIRIPKQLLALASFKEGDDINLSTNLKLALQIEYLSTVFRGERSIIYEIHRFIGYDSAQPGGYS
jgi:antitoxin component of MazEF toxin-antitoxin module